MRNLKFYLFFILNNKDIKNLKMVEVLLYPLQNCQVIYRLEYIFIYIRRKEDKNNVCFSFLENTITEKGILWSLIKLEKG